MTGSMPGIAASTRLTLALGAEPNAVEAPENSFASDFTCACTSMPMITSQSPVAPEMKRFGSGVRVSMMVMEPASFDMGGGGKCDLPKVRASGYVQTTRGMQASRGKPADNANGIQNDDGLLKRRYCRAKGD